MAIYVAIILTIVKKQIFTSRPFLKMAVGIVLGSVTIFAVSEGVLPYISLAIKASFLKLGM